MLLNQVTNKDISLNNFRLENDFVWRMDIDYNVPDHVSKDSFRTACLIVHCFHHPLEVHRVSSMGNLIENEDQFVFYIKRYQLLDNHVKPIVPEWHLIHEMLAPRATINISDKIIEYLKQLW